jgi:predicted metal-dependent peptidase
MDNNKNSTSVNTVGGEASKQTVTVVVTQQLPPIPEKVLALAAENLESAIMKIIHEGRFFSNLLLNFRREFTNKLPTLGVNVTDEVNLFINPYFFNSMSPIERVEVLKHECYHVINNHFVRFRDLEPQIFDVKERTHQERKNDQESASVLNKAADYAINEYLPLLPKDMKMFTPAGELIVQPETFADGKPNPDAGKPLTGTPLLVKDLKKQIPHILEQQSLEYYYEFLKQQQEKDKQKGGGGGGGGWGSGGGGGGGPMTIDDHSIWHESDATEDQITDKVKAVVNKALEATPDREKGNLSMDIQQAIAALNHVPRDWRQDVQRFVARTAEIIIDSSRKRRNRRYGILYPGIVTFPKLHIAIGIDSSGSVHDDELNQFFAEMGRLHNMEIVLTVIECDTKVNGVYKFDPKKPFLTNGRGGTSFKPVFEECDNLEVDGLIYFTDGECWDEGIKKPKYPVLWALVGGKTRQPPYKWGGRTYIEVKKKVHV